MSFHRARRVVLRLWAPVVGARTSGAFLSQFHFRTAVWRLALSAQSHGLGSPLSRLLLSAQKAQLFCRSPRRPAGQGSALRWTGLFQVLIADSHSVLVGEI